MLKDLTFTEKWRCFNEGDTIVFRPGVNLLVGDQGTGKSSLLQAIAATSKARKYQYQFDLAKKVKVNADKIECGGIDFEKDNPRIRPDPSDKNIKARLAALWSSHGQTNNALLRGIAGFSNMLIFMDEPDMALSIRSIHNLVGLFNGAASRGCQIVAAVHNPMLIQAYPEVYSLEKRDWITSGEFVASQLLEFVKQS
jgi:predicted ATPase